MTIIQWILLFIGVYLAIGVAMMFFLLETPYAENPIWVMILFWWAYL